MVDDRNSVKNTLVVAIGLSIVCSILVAGAAVILKPKQEQNATDFRQRIILEVAGLYVPGTAPDLDATDSPLVSSTTRVSGIPSSEGTSNAT